MLVFIPMGYQTINNMLNELRKESITEILAILQKNYEMFFEEDIHVYLPKFKLDSDFNMERVFERVGKD